jgi:hypothetical protein
MDYLDLKVIGKLSSSLVCEESKLKSFLRCIRNSLCKAFATKTSPARKIFSIDSRNHGESPHTSQHSYPLMSDDIARFVEDHNLGKVAVLGVSKTKSYSMTLKILFVKYSSYQLSIQWEVVR